MTMVNALRERQDRCAVTPVNEPLFRPTSALRELHANEVFGGFRLERRLGEGGTGVVWAAVHTRSQRHFALKILKVDLTRTEARRRFVREARAAGRVVHPNVVRVHQVVEIEGAPPAIVMELLHGETLREKLERQRVLSIDELLAVMLPVLAAIQVAHEAGIVHRDLKPDNIFLCAGTSQAPTVKVLDFGLAKLAQGSGWQLESSSPTATGSMLGTPYYMAPEQVFGERDLDGRADLWSLGVVMYECVAGIRPTEGANVGQVLKRITTQGLTPVEAVAPHTPPGVAAVIQRLLRAARHERPSSAAEVAELLQTCVRGGSRAGALPPLRRTQLAPPGARWLAATFAICVAGGALVPWSKLFFPPERSATPDGRPNPRAAASTPRTRAVSSAFAARTLPAQTERLAPQLEALTPAPPHPTAQKPRRRTRPARPSLSVDRGVGVERAPEQAATKTGPGGIIAEPPF